MVRHAEALEATVRRAQKLGAMPQAALELIHLTSDPAVDPNRLRACVESDPALCVRLLRAANSSMFAPARPIVDLGRAILLLGAKTVRLLALSSCLSPTSVDLRHLQTFDRYRRRALLRAAAAREFAAIVHWNIGDEAFVAALLYDVGIAGLLQTTPDDYAPLFEAAGFGEIDLVDGERRVFGFDHVELTRRLLREWNVPAAIVAAGDEARSALVAGTRPGRVARVVLVAELLAAAVADDRVELWPALVEGAERHLELSAEALTSAAARIDVEVAALADALTLVEFPPDAVQALEKRFRSFVPAVAAEAVRDLTARRAVGVERPNLADDAASSNPDPTKLLALLDRLRSTAAACRDRREPLSLGLVESEGVGEAVFGVVISPRLIAEWPEACVFDLTASRKALVFPHCDRREALGRIEELRERFDAGTAGIEAGHRMSVGLATVQLPPRDLPVAEVVEAAERCLHAARLSAGSAVKSIELY